MLRSIRPSPRALIPFFAALLPFAPAAAADSVTLKFAWPEGMRAHASFLSKTTKKSSLGNTETTSYGTFDVTVSAAPQGLRVATGKIDLRIKIGGPKPSTERLTGKLPSLMPDILVDRGGHFVGLADRDQQVRRFEKQIDAVIDQFPATLQKDFRTSGKAFASNMVQRFEAGQGNRWNRIIGVLAGIEFRKGQTVVRKIAQPIPLLMNQAVPVTSAVTFVKRARCGKRRVVERCLELLVETTIDAEAAKAAAQRAVRKRNPKVDGVHMKIPVARKYDRRSRMRMLVEPDTLLVHRIQMDETVIASVVEGERIENFVKKTDQKLAYKY